MLEVYYCEHCNELLCGNLKICMPRLFADRVFWPVYLFLHRTVPNHSCTALLQHNIYLQRGGVNYCRQNGVSVNRCVGVISTLSWGIGPIVGGPLMSRKKITVSRALCLTVIFHVVSFSGYLSAVFVNCPEAPWAGSISDNGLVPARCDCRW